MMKKIVSLFTFVIAAYFLISIPFIAQAQGKNHSEELTICSPFLREIREEQLEAFQQAYPHTYPPIEVQMMEVDARPESMQDWYTAQISSGQCKADLFLLYDTTVNLDYFIRHGLVTELPGEDLQRDVQSMNQEMVDCVTDDQGILYAYPVTTYGTCPTVKPALLEETGLGSVPNTMEEYLDQLVAWYTSEKYACYHSKYRFDSRIRESHIVEDAFRQLAISYIHSVSHTRNLREGDYVGFGGPAFQNVMTKLEKLYPVQMKNKKGVEDLPTIYSSKPLEYGLPADEFYLCDLPFSSELNAGRVIHAVPAYLVRNPHGENGGNAMKFIRWYAANRTPEQAFRLYPNASYTGDNEWILANEQELQALLLNTCFDCNRYQYAMFYRINFWDIISPYFKGEATSSEVLIELNRQIEEQLEPLQ